MNKGNQFKGKPIVGPFEPNLNVNSLLSLRNEICNNLRFLSSESDLKVP